MRSAPRGELFSAFKRTASAGAMRFFLLSEPIQARAKFVRVSDNKITGGIFQMNSGIFLPEADRLVITDAESKGAQVSDPVRILAVTADYLNMVPPALREASKFHLAQPGKQLRGVIAYQSAQYFGVSSERALGWAAAVELLHNASLIHDDICDGDLQRRGRDTVFKRFGESIAICLGDYYIGTAFGILAKIDAPAPCIGVFAQHMQAIIGGQASEFVFIGYPDWENIS